MNPGGYQIVPYTPVLLVFLTSEKNRRSTRDAFVCVCCDLCWVVAGAMMAALSNQQDSPGAEHMGRLLMRRGVRYDRVQR